MGIPSYFSQVIRKYARIMRNHDFFNNTAPITHLYMDCNSIVYDSYHSLAKTFKYTPEQHSEFEDTLIQMVATGIEKYIYMIHPTEVVYISFDGVAPIAKMKQQRYRRYHSYKEKLLIKNIYKKHGIDKGTTWDTNAITPGTMFLTKLSLYLQKSLPLKKLKQKYNIKLLLSDSSVPGEGEHKIISYMRDNIDATSINILYGLDADLIMLSLCLDFNIYLLREATHFGQIKKDHLLYFSIPNLKNNLYDEISQYIDAEDFEIIKNNIIIDYVFICFLMGNDFLPSMLFCIYIQI